MEAPAAEIGTRASFLQSLKRRFFLKNPVKEQSQKGLSENKIDNRFKELIPEKKLSYAPRLFFHTTLAKNLNSIKRDGLFSFADDPNLGRSIGYSLYFPLEHQERQPAAEFSSDEYIMTVWEINPLIRKFKDSESLRNLVVDVAGSAESESLSEDFVFNSPLGELVKQLPPDQIRNLAAEHLIAAIALKPEVRDGITKAMVLAAAGKISADEIEQNLLALLPENTTFLKEGIDSLALAHYLTAAIERDLVRSTIMPKIEEVREDKGGKPIATLWHALVYRSNVNDSVTAKYLDNAISWLRKIVQGQNADANQILSRLLDNLEKVKKGQEQKLGSDYDLSAGKEYFFSTHAEQAAAKMRQMLDI